MKRIPILLISLYRRLISPAIPRRCKYHPSCSEYSVQAYREWGFVRGSGLSVWRLLRCNPLSHGGFDPVRKRGQSREEHAALKFGHDVHGAEAIR